MKIGIYGGTFAPPHRGHYEAARAFLAEFPIDRLYIVPAFLPPHKEISDDDNPALRYEMARLCFSSLPKTEISDTELLRKGKSYTSDTLREFHAGVSTDVSFLCGTDMFLTMAQWHEPETVFSLAKIVCVRRESDPANDAEIARKAADYRQKFGARISFLAFRPMEISSTEIRERVRNGEMIDGLVTKEVSAFISNHNLYRGERN